MPSSYALKLQATERLNAIQRLFNTDRNLSSTEIEMHLVEIHRSIADLASLIEEIEKRLD